MRKFAVIFVLVLIAAAVSAQVKETVLNEDFSDNHLGWPEDINDAYTASVNRGTYYIEHMNGKGSKTFDIPTKLYFGDNFFIETTGKIVGGDKTNGFGIVWGKGPMGFFSFVITADGKFYVRKVQKGSPGEYIVLPTASKFIHTGGVENNFRVQYSRNELSFFVNGKYLAHIPRVKYYGDNAGIIIYGHHKVEISNFGIYGTKNYESIPGYGAQMYVSYYEIDDYTNEDGSRVGNGNCKVEPGETVRLAIAFKNQSYAACKDLNATIYALSQNVRIVNADKPQRIVNVGRLQSQTLNLTFKVNQACNLDVLKFKIDVTDDKDRLGESVTFNVPMRTKIPPINKDVEAGHISLTFNIKEDNTDDINTSFPITLNNARNTCAVVIGVESYKTLPKATYATNDAKGIYNYLVKVVNVPRQNVISVSNENATLQKVKDIFKLGGLLQYKVMSNAENVIVYFSGLGMCPYAKTSPYIMLYDSDASYPQTTGYALANLLKDIKAMNPRTVICMFETSFAGVDRKGVSFSPKGGTVWSNAQFPVITDNSTCMLYASGGQQVNPLEESTSHGMFTHYLMTALQIAARNRNSLNMNNLYDYIYQRMDRQGIQRNISVFPRMDCQNKDGLKLLK